MFFSSLRTRLGMKIVPVAVRSDNYAYLIIDQKAGTAAAVDPYDVPKVSSVARELGVRIVSALTTHHHHDHSGGNQAFAASFPAAAIFGGSEKSPAVTSLVKDKDEFSISDHIRVKCLATPCHTQDSICYHVTDTSTEQPAGLFTGDTLFIAGSGRFFEGNGAEMHAALAYLGTLPDNTVVYNGHEYTAGNLAFAKSIDPENPAMARLEKLVQEHTVTTGLTTMGDEQEWNPFMRLGTDAVKKATAGAASESDVMDALRELKNNYRA